jgi:hypothetical protein
MTASKRPRSVEAAVPAAGEGEVPSYDVHIAPIVKRYCISCHRAGKDNNDYLMTTYEEVLTTGENVDTNVIAGDPEQLPAPDHPGNPIMDPENPVRGTDRRHAAQGTMSSNRSCGIDAFIRWIMNGMPLQTAEEASRLFAALFVDDRIPELGALDLGGLSIRRAKS